MTKFIFVVFLFFFQNEVCSNKKNLNVKEGHNCSKNISAPTFDKYFACLSKFVGYPMFTDLPIIRICNTET